MLQVRLLDSSVSHSRRSMAEAAGEGCKQPAEYCHALCEDGLGYTKSGKMSRKCRKRCKKHWHQVQAVFEEYRFYGVCATEQLIEDQGAGDET